MKISCIPESKKVSEGDFMDAEQREADRILDFDGFPGYWKIRESSNDERFETYMKIEESGELPSHKHPSAEESYEVLAGTMEVHQDGEWEKLSAGEKHTVPQGAMHAFRTNGPVEVINVHKPALRYEEYFRRFHKLKTEAGVEMPPKNLKGMILLGMLQAEYEREFIGVNPPQWVFKLMAGLGRLLGYSLPE